mmetsp:Transcript_51806/g.83595  ORF Transcript_51806/g.83595 Transcript_51806/m.83595 type:complete len:81 (-) Transcript_51806:49-291(-)
MVVMIVMIVMMRSIRKMGNMMPRVVQWQPFVRNYLTRVASQEGGWEVKIKEFIAHAMGFGVHHHDERKEIRCSDWNCAGS